MKKPADELLVDVMLHVAVVGLVVYMIAQSFLSR